MMSSFPDFHFPTSFPPRGNSSEVHDAFGCLQGFDVRSGDTESEFCFQYDVGNRQGLQLVPTGPNLPFLPPNEGSSVSEASIQDYIRRASVTKATVVNVQQQVEECYRHVPEAFTDPLCDILDDQDLQIVANFNDLTSKRKKPLKVQANIMDGMMSVGIRRPLLHCYLREELLYQVDRMHQDASFYCGCLAFEPISSEASNGSRSGGLLFYPSGQGMDRVNIHYLESRNDGEDLPQLRPTSWLHQMDLANRVRQIDTQHVLHGKSTLAAVRTDYRCYVLKARVRQKKGRVECKLLHDMCSQCRVTSLALSPHVAGECVFSTEYGQTLLINTNSKVCASTPDVSRTSKGAPSFSHFTPHPRLIFGHTKDQSYQLDFRIAGNSVSSRHPLFTLPSSCLPCDQYFCVARQHPINHYYHYLATQHYLLLTDERFPGHTVLQWPHILSSPPNYLSIVPSVLSSSCSSSTPSEDSDLCFAASFSSKETHCFQCSSLSGETPHAARAPRKLQHNDAWLDLMSTVPARGEALLRRRLARPLIGICAMRQGTGGSSGVTVFQLTEVGDVFQQVLRTAGPDEAPAPCARSDWCGGRRRREERRCQEYVERLLRAEGGALEATHTLPASRAIAGDIRKAMMKPVIHRRECSLCHHGDGQLSSRSSESLKSAAYCRGCGLRQKHSRALKRLDGTNILTSKTRKKSSQRASLLDDKIKKSKVKDELGRRLWASWHQDHSSRQEETSFEEKPVRRSRKQLSSPEQDIVSSVSMTPLEFLGRGFDGPGEVMHAETPSSKVGAPLSGHTGRTGESEESDAMTGAIPTSVTSLGRHQELTPGMAMNSGAQLQDTSLLDTLEWEEFREEDEREVVRERRGSQEGEDRVQRERNEPEASPPRLAPTGSPSPSHPDEKCSPPLVLSQGQRSPVFEVLSPPLTLTSRLHSPPSVARRLSPLFGSVLSPASNPFPLSSGDSSPARNRTTPQDSSVPSHAMNRTPKTSHVPSPTKTPPTTPLLFSDRGTGPLVSPIQSPVKNPNSLISIPSLARIRSPQINSFTKYSTAPKRKVHSLGF